MNLMYSKLFLSLIFLLFGKPAFCQEFQAEPEPEKVVVVEGDTVIYYPETGPIFPGGKVAMDEYFKKNLPGYSKTQSKKNNKLMWVSFVIRSSGRIGKTNIISNEKPEIAEKLIQVLKSLPTWTPAVYKGKKVATIGDYYFYFE
jgi:hypothetical protein